MGIRINIENIVRNYAGLAKCREHIFFPKDLGLTGLRMLVRFLVPGLISLLLSRP